MSRRRTNVNTQVRCSEPIGTSCRMRQSHEQASQAVAGKPEVPQYQCNCKFRRTHAIKGAVITGTHIGVKVLTV